MQIKILLAITLLLIFSSPAFPFPAKVVNVADGDTVTVLTPDMERIKIRLYGIDCPEKKQAFGRAAGKATANMIAGEVVDVEEVGRDRYGRTVGIIRHNGKIINRELVKAGYAWVYRQYCKEKECWSWYKDEARARAERRGLWRDKDPIPPWAWRKAMRGK